MRKHPLLFTVGLCTSLAASAAGTIAASVASPAVFDVRTYGARGNGARLDTPSLQRAIDACSQAGGGLVLVPRGTYLTGTLYLRSHVRLRLAQGATLLASRKLDHFPPTVPRLRSYTDLYTDKSLIYAEDLADVGIEGPGSIDGRGTWFSGPYKHRPFLMRFVGCRNVTIQGVTLKNGAMWTQHYLACRGVSIDGITVRSRCNINNDGIDIDSSELVRISNCDISTADDAIVLKSTTDRPCRDVRVTNCRLSSDCNALKLGTESSGGFQNITFQDCTIYDTKSAGIAIESVDGGILDGVAVSGIRMANVKVPIFVRLGDRARPWLDGRSRPAVGRVRNVRLSDIDAVGAHGVGCSITGTSKQPAEEVSLENIRISFAGGGQAHEQPHRVRERTGSYPESTMFGSLPAYGFFCRHVTGLRFNNVQLSFEETDRRPSMFCENVRDLEVKAWTCDATENSPAALLLRNVQTAYVDQGRSRNDISPFLRLDGAQTAKIRLGANDWTVPRKMVHLGPAVSPEAINWPIPALAETAKSEAVP